MVKALRARAERPYNWRILGAMKCAMFTEVEGMGSNRQNGIVRFVELFSFRRN